MQNYESGRLEYTLFLNVGLIKSYLYFCLGFSFPALKDTDFNMDSEAVVQSLFYVESPFTLA